MGLLEQLRDAVVAKVDPKLIQRIDQLPRHNLNEFGVDPFGFDPAAVPTAHGLTGMRDRIRAAGGELVLTSSPGAGTRVEGTFPAPPRDA